MEKEPNDEDEPKNGRVRLELAWLRLLLPESIARAIATVIRAFADAIETDGKWIVRAIAAAIVLSVPVVVLYWVMHLIGNMEK